MKKFLIAIILLGFANTLWCQQKLTSAEKQAYFESHNSAFQALNEKIRDPFILNASDGYYYLTGKTAGSHWGDTIGIHLWRSKNLIDWEDMGFVCELYQDNPTKECWPFKQSVRNPEYKNPIAVWAPEIHFLNGNWYIPFCINISGHGLLKSKTGKPEGPYEMLNPAGLKGIDPTLYQDSDGKIYYAYQADKIALMNDSLTQCIKEFSTLEHEGKHPLGYEGILIMKFDDKYVHIASGRYGYESSNTYDLYYAVSKNIYGPYGKRRMAIKNAGHGNLVQDKNGRWWSTAFDHEYTSMWSLWLVPVDIKVSKRDVKFEIKDSRFAPDKKDIKEVKELSKKGIPEEWKGKAPWWRPE